MCRDLPQCFTTFVEVWLFCLQDYCKGSLLRSPWWRVFQSWLTKSTLLLLCWICTDSWLETELNLANMQSRWSHTRMFAVTGKMQALCIFGDVTTFGRGKSNYLLDCSLLIRRLFPLQWHKWVKISLDNSILVDSVQRRFHWSQTDMFNRSIHLLLQSERKALQCSKQ